jgi:hypothetical protein
MAAKTGLSHTMLRRFWRTVGLQPHRARTFKWDAEPTEGTAPWTQRPPKCSSPMCSFSFSRKWASQADGPILAASLWAVS